MYDEIKFWNKKSKPNHFKAEQSVRKNRHIEFVKSNLFKGCTVFEFGPGDGRLLPAYENIVSLLFAYDISSQWKKEYINKAKNYSFPFVHFTDYCLRDDLSQIVSNFDVVVASLVLLHQKPSRIDMVMNNLANICKYVIVISKSTKSASINQKDEKATSYDYDYIEICKNNNLYYSPPIYKNNQIYFCYGRIL